MYFPELNNCNICPRNCNTNRNNGILGYCGSNSEMEIASVCLHTGEEPPINGLKGICNIFFTGCNLKCLYCQNYQISRRKNKLGKTYKPEDVVEVLKTYLDQGIEAVGFVSPSHYSLHIKEIISLLNHGGYKPVTVYNTNCYDKPEIIKDLEGVIDIYLPDFKYFDPEISRSFSDAYDYPEVAKKALLEMYRQKGSTVVINENGQAVNGLIVRHLVLPGQANDSVKIMEWIASELSTGMHISLMSQYYPTACVNNHNSLGRKITADEYNKVVNSMEDLGFYRGWIQEFESAVTYRPDFERSHPFE